MASPIEMASYPYNSAQCCTTVQPVMIHINDIHV